MSLPTKAYNSRWFKGKFKIKGQKEIKQKKIKDQKVNPSGLQENFSLSSRYNLPFPAVPHSREFF